MNIIERFCIVCCFTCIFISLEVHIPPLFLIVLESAYSSETIELLNYRYFFII